MLTSIMGTRTVSIRPPYVVCCLLLLFGLLIVSVGTAALLDQRAFTARALKVPGTITGLVKNTSGRERSPPEFPRFTFKTVNGLSIRKTDRTRSGEGYNIGDPISVLYDPQNPTTAYMFPHPLDQTGFTVIIGGGVLFIALAVFIWVVRPKPAAPLPS